MKLLVTSLGVFLLSQITQNIGLASSFVSSYLDDLLFFPIALSIIWIVENKKRKYEIPVYHSIIGLGVISVLFEVIIPNFDARFTSDYVDVIFYSLGIVLFYTSRSLGQLFTPKNANHF